MTIDDPTNCFQDQRQRYALNLKKCSNPVKAFVVIFILNL